LPAPGADSERGRGRNQRAFRDVGTIGRSLDHGAELSKEVAFRVRERVPGLTLDWLWFGYWAGTPVELARNLRQLLDATQPMSGS